jgi:hypothetical protein
VPKRFDAAGQRLASFDFTTNFSLSPNAIENLKIGGSTTMGLEFGQARNHTTWHPEPEGRGTYGLLSTCLLTMILCVWTAVHLNLPEHRRHSVSYLPSFQTLRKLRWLLIGLFAPEVVSWSAFEQYREATTLYNDMKEALGEETPCSKFQTFKNSLLRRTEFLSKSRDVEKGPDLSPLDFDFPTTPKRKPRRNEWTMIHSYYVIMGKSRDLSKCQS